MIKVVKSQNHLTTAFKDKLNFKALFSIKEKGAAVPKRVDNSMQVYELETRQMLSADIGSLALTVDTGESDTDLYTTIGNISGTTTGAKFGDQQSIEIDVDGDQVADYTVSPEINFKLGTGNFEFDISQYEELLEPGEKDFDVRVVTTDFYDGTSYSNWSPVSFHLSEFDAATLGQSSEADTFYLTGKLSGIGVDDTATGTGFIMYSEENVHSRFTVNAQNSNWMVAVRFNTTINSWEYSTDVDGEWLAFESVDTDRLIAAVDFDNDTIESLKGELGEIHGIASGISDDSSLTFQADAFGAFDNEGEFTISGPEFQVNTLTQLKSTRTEIGATNKGVAVDDDATGLGYIMYSAESIHTRFSANAPDADQADHLIAVRYNDRESFWEYNADGEDWYQFTIAEGDRLLATIDYTFDTIDSLQGALGDVFGIEQGFTTGDLTFEVNQWDGTADDGEFLVEGTYFTVAPIEIAQPERFEIGAINKGVGVDDAATGTGYIMYSSANVHERFADNAPNEFNSDYLIAVRYNQTGEYWEYNANDTAWHEFEVSGTDRLIATVDFDNDTIESLQGATGEVHGMLKGFNRSDLVFEANMWDGSTNVGEFTVSGTYFVVNPVDKGTEPTLRFTSVSIGETSSRTITFENTGTHSVDIEKVSVPFGFDVIGFTSTTLAPGQTIDIVVEMTGIVGGALGGNLAIQTLSQGTQDIHTVELTGNVYNPEVEVTAGGVAYENQVDFGVLSTSSDGVIKQFEITNTGQSTITLSDEITLPEGFVLTSGLSQTVLAAGESATFMVAFIPTEPGQFTGTVRVDLADRMIPVFIGTVFGEVDVPRLAVSVDGGDFEHTGGQVDFGAVMKDTAVEHTIVFKNEGTTQLDVSDIDVPTGMELVGFTGSFVLAAGAQVSYVLRLDSSDSMSADDTIIVYSNDPNESEFGIATRGAVLDVQAPELLNDVDTADGISSDPRVVIQLAEVPIYVGEGDVILHVDTDGDDVADESYTVTAERFVYDPQLEEEGQFSRQFQIEVYNHVNDSSEFTSWMSFSAEYDSTQENAEPVLSSLQLAGDGLSGSQMMSPVITGTVSNDGSLVDLVVLVDHDGDGVTDGYAAVEHDGTFEYYGAGLGLGSHVLSFSVAEITYSGEVVVTEEQDISFELIAYPTPDFTSVQLEYPSPTSETTTSIPVIKGVVDEGDANGRYLVVWDTDEDGDYLNATEVDENGNFNFSATVNGPDTYTIYLKTVDQETGAISETAESFTFALVSMTAPTLTSYGLANDTSGGSSVTSDPTVEGSINSEWGVANREIQFDYDGDDEADGVAYTDENGDFVFLPEALAFGVAAIQIRTVIFDTVTGENVYSSWSPLNFTFERELDVDIVGFDLDEDDGAGNTTNPTVSGVVESSPGTPAPFTEIEFHYDTDEFADATTIANGLGEFSHYADVPIGQEVTVRVRARQIDPYNNQYIYGDWESVTFTRQAGAPDVGNSHSDGVAASSTEHSEAIAGAISEMMDDLRDQFNGSGGGGGGITPPAGTGGVSNNGFNLGHISLVVGTNNEAFGVTGADDHSIDIGQDSSDEYFIVATGGSAISVGSATLTTTLTVGDFTVDAELDYTITNVSGTFTFDYTVTFTLTTADSDEIDGTIDGVLATTGSAFTFTETIDILGTVDDSEVANTTDYESTLTTQNGAWNSTSATYDFTRTEIINNAAALVIDDSGSTGDADVVQAGTYGETGSAEAYVASINGTSFLTKDISRDYDSDYDYDGTQSRSVNKDGVSGSITGPQLEDYDSDKTETATYNLVDGAWVFVDGSFTQTIISNSSITETSSGTYTEHGSGTALIDLGSYEGYLGGEKGVVATYTYTAVRTVTENATYIVNADIASNGTVTATYTLEGGAGYVVDVDLSGTLAGTDGNISTTGTGSKTYDETSTLTFDQTGGFTSLDGVVLTVTASGDKTNTTISSVVIDGTKTVTGLTFEAESSKYLTLNHNSTSTDDFDYSFNQSGFTNTGTYTIDSTTTSTALFDGEVEYTGHATHALMLPSGTVLPVSVTGTSSASSEMSTSMTLDEDGNYTIDEDGSVVTGTFYKEHDEDSSGDSAGNLVYSQTNTGTGFSHVIETTVVSSEDWEADSASTDDGSFTLYFDSGVAIDGVTEYDGEYGQGPSGELSVISGDYTNDGETSGTTTVNISYSEDRDLDAGVGSGPNIQSSSSAWGHANTTTTYTATSDESGDYTITDGVKEGTGTYTDTRNSTTVTDSATNLIQSGGIEVMAALNLGSSGGVGSIADYTTENVTTIEVFTETGSHVDLAGETTATGNYSSTIDIDGSGTSGSTRTGTNFGSSVSSSTEYTRDTSDVGTSVTVAPTEAFEQSESGGSGSGGVGGVTYQAPDPLEIGESGGNTTRTGTFTTDYSGTTDSNSYEYRTENRNGYSYDSREWTVGFSEDSFTETNGEYDYAADGSGTRSADFESESDSDTLVISTVDETYLTPGAASPYIIINVLGIPFVDFNRAKGEARSDETHIVSITTTDIYRTEDGESEATTDTSGVTTNSSTADFYQDADNDNFTHTSQFGWSRYSDRGIFIFTSYDTTINSLTFSDQIDDGTSTAQAPTLGLIRDDAGTTETSTRELDKTVHSISDSKNYTYQSYSNGESKESNVTTKATSKSTYDEDGTVTEFIDTEGERSNVQSDGTYEETESETRKEVSVVDEHRVVARPSRAFASLNSIEGGGGSGSSASGEHPGDYHFEDTFKSKSNSFSEGSFDNTGSDVYIIGTFNSNSVFKQINKSNSTTEGNADAKTKRNGTNKAKAVSRTKAKQTNGSYVQSSVIGESYRNYDFKNKTVSSGNGNGSYTLSGTGITGSGSNAYSSSSLSLDRGRVEDDGETNHRKTRFSGKSSSFDTSTGNKSQELSYWEIIWISFNELELPWRTTRWTWSNAINDTSNNYSGNGDIWDYSQLGNYSLQQQDPSYNHESATPSHYRTKVDKDKTETTQYQNNGMSTGDDEPYSSQTTVGNETTTTLAYAKIDQGEQTFYYMDEIENLEFLAEGSGVGDQIADADYTTYDLEGNHKSDEIVDNFYRWQSDYQVSTSVSGEVVEHFEEHYFDYKTEIKYNDFENHYEASSPGQSAIEDNWIEELSVGEYDEHRNWGNQTGTGSTIIEWDYHDWDDDYRTRTSSQNHGESESTTYSTTHQWYDYEYWETADGTIYDPGAQTGLTVHDDEFTQASVAEEFWWDEWGETILDWVQYGLDALGMIPGIGWAFDLINAGIYVARGQYIMAGLSLAAAIPGVGNAVTAAKWAGKVGVAAAKSSKFVGAAGKALSGGAKLGSKAIGMATNGAKRAVGYVGKAVSKNADSVKSAVCRFGPNCFVGETEVLIYDAVPKEVVANWTIINLPPSESDLSELYDESRAFAGAWLALSSTGIVIVLARRVRRQKKSGLQFNEMSWPFGVDVKSIKTVTEKELAGLRRFAKNLFGLGSSQDSNLNFAWASPAGEIKKMYGETNSSVHRLVGNSMTQRSDELQAKTLHAVLDEQSPKIKFRNDEMEVSEAPMRAKSNSNNTERTSYNEEDFKKVLLEAKPVMVREYLRPFSSWTSHVLLAILLISTVLSAWAFFGRGANESQINDKETRYDSAVTLAGVSGRENHRLNLDGERLHEAGISSPEKITAIPIRKIRVGMRVPAQNPEYSETKNAIEALGIQKSTWRKFTFAVEQPGVSGTEEISLLRPSSWLVEQRELTAALMVDAVVEEAIDDWNQLPAWQKSFSELRYLGSFEAWIDKIAQAVDWIGFCRQLTSTGNIQTGLVCVGSVELNAYLFDKVENHLAMESAIADVQLGGSIGDLIWLELPGNKTSGFARLVANEPYEQCDVDNFMFDLGLREEQVDPATWKKITLLCPRDDGSETEATLLRSPEWIRSSIQLAVGAKVESIDKRLVGAQIEIVIPEISINGMARVLAIDDCPRIQGGPGEVVTGTFVTNHAQVLNLTFAGLSETIGVTANHPIWSKTQQAFVDAGSLEIGEEVLAINGKGVQLNGIEPAARPERVYNFEVANEHVYFVSCKGLLVHNAAYFKGDILKAIKGGDTIAKGLLGHAVKIRRATKIGRGSNLAVVAIQLKSGRIIHKAAYNVRHVLHSEPILLAKASKYLKKGGKIVGVYSDKIPCGMRRTYDQNCWGKIAEYAKFHHQSFNVYWQFPGRISRYW